MMAISAKNYKNNDKERATIFLCTYKEPGLEEKLSLVICVWFFAIAKIKLYYSNKNTKTNSSTKNKIKL